MSEVRKRRSDVDIARAFAQFAVVIHHICQYSSRYGLGTFNSQFGNSLVAIVSFIHIPTFMLIAGIVLAMAGTEFRDIDDYLHFEGKKFCRLMLPFLAISLMHLAIKSVAPGEGMSTGTTALKNMVVAPAGGAAGHLWFLYCLMSIFLVWPLLSRLASGRRLPILFTGLLILAILPIVWPEDQGGRPLLGLRDLVWYLPIFTLGYWYGRQSLGARKYGWIAIVIAGCLLVVSLLAYLLISWPEKFLWQTLQRAVRMIGFISAGFCLLWLSGIIATWSNVLRSCLATAGLYSYDIYLLHVALVGHPLCFVFSKLHLGQVMTYVLFIVLIFVTMIVPIGIGWLIRRVPLLAFVMLGVPMRRHSRLKIA